MQRMSVEDGLFSSFYRSSGAARRVDPDQLPSQSVDISGGEIIPFSSEQPPSQINIENAETDINEIEFEVDAVKSED